MTTRETADRLIEQYGVTLDGDTITTPGKFEGENFSILYWYDAMMNGDGDAILDDDDYSIIGDQFTILPEDRDSLCLPTDANYAVLWHSEQGFEHLEYTHESIA